MTSKLDFIVVEGPIGVGKTTLAKRLARSFNSDVLLEGASENPFLERFYQDPRSAALQTQLFFLFQRTQQLQDLKQQDLFRPVQIADFIIEKDRLFAQMTLDEDEYKLYEQVYKHVTIDAPAPDLVIYLQAPVEVLMKRVAKRGRSMERNMDAEYMERVIESYTRFFYDYARSPLLIVNATDIDLVNNQADYQRLLEQINKTQRGRHYFNPTSLGF